MWECLRIESGLSKTTKYYNTRYLHRDTDPSAFIVERILSSIARPDMAPSSGMFIE
jgi:hypothetical protein